MFIEAGHRLTTVPRFRSWKQREWHALHTFAADPHLDLRAAPAWLARFEKRIPCKQCRAHWRRLTRDHPPELTTRRTFFRWTVRMHNEINVRCGHPLMRFEDACSEWNFFDTEAHA